MHICALSASERYSGTFSSLDKYTVTKGIPETLEIGRDFGDKD